MLLGLFIVRINYKSYFLTKEGLVNGVLGY
jgi:hypothetical protein